MVLLYLGICLIPIMFKFLFQRGFVQEDFCLGTLYSKIGIGPVHKHKLKGDS